MGLDSPDHTKSGPSGSGFFYTTSFVIATENENLTRRANHRHDRAVIPGATSNPAVIVREGGRSSKRRRLDSL